MFIGHVIAVRSVGDGRHDVTSVDGDGEQLVQDGEVPEHGHCDACAVGGDARPFIGEKEAKVCHENG